MGVKEKMRLDDNGFTMMEVMIVVALIGILALTAIPTFSVWIPDYRLKGAVQDIYSNLQLTKMEAIRTKSNQSLTFFSPNATSYTKTDGTSIDLTSYGSGITFGYGDAGTGVYGESKVADSVSYETPDNVAQFNSRGMGNNTGNSGNGFVYLTNSKGTAYAVGSLTSGVVVLFKWKGSNWE